ncbi:MAG: type II secretion system F family protein [Agromyces sp.]
MTLTLNGVYAAALLAMLAGILAPFVWLIRAAERRRMRCSDAWPDVVDHLVSAVRSGMPLPDALGALGTCGPREVRPQFARFAALYRASGAWDDALDHLKLICADPTADRLVETVRISRLAGGSEVVPVLRAFSEFLRAEHAVLSELHARQSWITNSARLGVSAPWVVLGLLCLRPETRHAYNSPSGALLVLVGGVLSAIAYVVMRRIGRFSPEPRWVRE